MPLLITFSVRAKVVENPPEINSLPYENILNTAATTLSNGSSDGLKNMATGAAASTVEQWLSQFGTAKVQLSVDENGRWDQSSVDLFTPVYDDKKSIWFTQFGMRAPDGRTTANLGSGGRAFYAKDWMFGANVFFDDDFTGKNRRIGVGTEAWTNYLKLSANTYIGTSNWHDSRDFDDYQEKPADGFDIRAESYLPSYPQLEAKVEYEKYYGDEVALFDTDHLQKNPSAVTTGLSYTPVPLVSFETNYKTGQNSMADAQFQVDLHYEFGRNWRDQINPESVQSMRTLAGSRYDLVDRNNQIIMQYRKKAQLGVSQLVLQNVVDNVPADGLTQNTLQVRATNSQNQPVSHAPIVWSTTGTAQFISSMATTNDEGMATAYLTNTSPEAVQVTAKSGNVSITQPCHFEEVTISHVSLALTKDNSIADGKSQNAALATVTDINNRPIANAKVTWAVDAPATLQNAQQTTDANGQAQAQLVSGTAGAYALKASAGALNVEQTTHFIANNADAQISDFTLSATNSPANGVTSDVALVTVRDPSGNPVSGIKVDVSADKSTVSFSGPAARATSMQTNASGQLRVMFTDTVAETAIITAALANGSSKTVAAQFSADTATAQIHSIAVGKDGSVANDKATNTAEAIVRDANGNAVSGVEVDKSTVKFAPSARTDSEGKASVAFTDTVAESVTIKADLANGSNKTATAHFIADTSTAALERLQVTQDGSPADGQSANIAEVYVTDAKGNPIADQDVTWSVDKSSVTVTPGGKTDATGKATVSYTSTFVQSFQITAALQNGDRKSIPSLFIADAASEKITAMVVTTGAIANGNATNLAKVTIVDANNNPVKNAVVTWITGGSATPDNATGTTDSFGKVSVTLTDKKAETVNVTAKLSSGASQTKEVSFTADSTTAQISIFTVTTGATANGTATDSGTVTVTDANNNPLSGVAVQWHASGNAEISQSSETTDVNGLATTTVTDTKAEKVVLFAAIPGKHQSRPIAFRPDTATAKIKALTVTTGALANGTAVDTGNVIIIDANDNPVSGVSVSWSVTGIAALSGTSSTSDASGTATITVTDIVAETGALTATLNGSSASQPISFIADVSTAIIPQIRVTADQALANGTDRNKVAVKVTDAKGNILSGQTVSWVVNSEDATVPATNTTDASGVSEIPISSTTPGLYTVTARMANGNMNTTQVSFLTAAQILPADITVSPDNAFADGSSTNGVRVKVTDGRGDPSPGQTVHFSAANNTTVHVVTGVTGSDGIASATVSSNTAGTSTVNASLDNGSVASVDMNFTTLLAKMASITVNAVTFDTSSGFPSTGFDKASFTLNIGGGKSNTDYNWTSSARWVVVQGQGLVQFSGQGSGEMVTITAAPKSGVGQSYAYYFSLKSWFYFDTALTDRANAESICSTRGMSLPATSEMTNALGVRVNGTRVPYGPLWSEWGSLETYSEAISSTDMNFSSEYNSTTSYLVRLTSGWIYTTALDTESRAACVLHF